ncbi:lysophospholipid acyltransferase family protein [Congregibacter litoralis]|uniref:Lauroyl/myristoyl acyltransferase n=1 Tax=Congregibacter litoralis KT71 TaxID=314285 RepID=A4A940_9GAMM|nr:lysophospholipid acyltransferase family protein [Congregibacter litoralis]EAQ97582.2 Lauroyl/myristoyl acyltransferase [Congregibacter litoralis KT71]
MKSRLIAFLLWTSSLLPLSVGRALGRGLGRGAWRVGGTPRRVTERNIGLAFPELSAAEQEKLARQSLEATGELAVEMGFVWNRPWHQVRAHILEIVGEEAVREALAEGQGVMMLGPHLGNWEIVGLHIAELGESVALYEPPHMQQLDNMVRTARQRSGSILVPTDARGLARLVKSLKKGGIAGILPDQVPPVEESGENSLFMGVPTFTMTLASKLLSKSGARAFFGFAERIPGGFRLHYLPADEGIYSGDMQLSLKALNDGVEKCVRMAPAQYQWEYKRFRVRPRGPVDYYAPDWRPESS